MGNDSKLVPAFQAIPLSNVFIDDCFWGPKLENNCTISLYHQYECLIKSGVLTNFKEANPKTRTNGVFQGLFFADSDAYKWLEAASYSISTHPDPRLEILIDEVISLIVGAQQKDGYINTYFQLVEPDKKFTNFGVCHELYTAGHLIQAAVAHFRATSKNTLFDSACCLADYLVMIFGPNKLEAVDGHAGIEVALVSLYRITGIQRYLELAKFFINQRGSSNSRLRWELAHLEEIAGTKGKPGRNNLKHYGSYESYDGRYAQDHLPVREQNEVVGHAVRAMYLYCGMADVGVETGDSSLIEVLQRLWLHLTTRRLYVTGGIGPARNNEGFTSDYDLPNVTACAETCAAVGMIMWNYRMLQITGEGRFADLLERVLYNAFLVGISMDGIKFFYYNPLQSRGDYHREEWHECACCPPNMARLFASLGGYIYSQFDNGLAVNLYIQSMVKTKLTTGTEIKLIQKTKYPWEGKIEFKLELAQGASFELLLRIPDWCHSYQVSVNNEFIEYPQIKGYVVIQRTWENGDIIEVDLEMAIERIQAYPLVWRNLGRVALQRGPLIYCLENVDHEASVEQITIPEDTVLIAKFQAALFGGIVTIEGKGIRPELANWEGKLYQTQRAANPDVQTPVTAIPYYCWDNREAGAMVVWISEK